MRAPTLQPAGFDYANRTRGYWARLRDGGGREVLVTAYPASLLSMLRAGVLVGQAKVDAEALLPGGGGPRSET